jgi:catechol 2,3-dioxygenase-like lactoylglutathione lyase family enzyme
MDIDQVTLTASDPEASIRWYRDTLGLSVADDAAEVVIGRSVLALRPGLVPEQGRGHHLAFDVPFHRFDAGVSWLGERATVLTKQGRTWFVGSAGWNSRSVYFAGPDGAVLELIGRADLTGDRADDGAPFGPGDLLSISEVGLAVTDAPAVARRICADSGLVPFVPELERFVPVGDQHGLLILFHVDKVLVPTESTRVLDAPVTVHARGPRDAVLQPTPHSTLVLIAGSTDHAGPDLAARSGAS